MVSSAVKLPPDMHDEALQAMWLLAVSLPFVMLTTGYVGVLSAQHEFRSLGILRAIMGVASFLGPLLMALWINRLDAIVAFVLVMRITATAAHAWLVRRSCGFGISPLFPDRPSARELLALGGWMSVSNVISPMLSYLDRLLLGALVPIRMVAFYATSFDLSSKALLLPHALMTSVFPSAAAVQPGSAEARRMLGQSMRLLFVLIFPPVFALIVLAQVGLSLWLGSEFASHAAPVLQVLALGILFNAVAQGPATLIQAAGQPRSMALLHLVELPVFVALLYGLTSSYGIAGTAAAAALRNGLDALAVLFLARRDVAKGEMAWRSSVWPVLISSALLVVALWPSSTLRSLLVLVLGLPIFAAMAWQLLLLPDERAGLLRYLRITK
jgi:O-antigen/teichoic acid export membrane protein